MVKESNLGGEGRGGAGERMCASGHGARERGRPWCCVHGSVVVVAGGRSSTVDVVALCQPWTMAKSVTSSDAGFSMMSSSSSQTRVGGHIHIM